LLSGLWRPIMPSLPLEPMHWGHNPQSSILAKALAMTRGYSMFWRCPIDVTSSEVVTSAPGGVQSTVINSTFNFGYVRVIWLVFAPTVSLVKLFTVVRAFLNPSVCCEWQGRKGEKGSTTRTPLIMTDNNGLRTGFIEGPPGQPGQLDIPGKKVGNVLNICHFISFKL